MKRIFVYRHHGFSYKDQPQYPDGFPVKMMLYNWFARSRQWTPRQVDELTLSELEWLPILEEACQQASEVIQKEIEAQRDR